MIELEHSPLGGSAANRFMKCSGSFLKQREQILDGQFENVETDFAKLGTAAHLLAATCLASDTEAFEHVNQDFEGFRAGWVGGVSLDAVTVYVNECRRIMEACDYDGLAIVEKTYTLSDLHPLLKGTVDFGYISPKHGIFLRDYKNGEGIGVHAIGNRQLLYYAFLLIMSFSEYGEENWDLETPVNLGIVQPNFWGLYEEPEIWVLTLREVWQWGRNELLPRMNALTEATGYAEDDFVPGDHCQFCPVLLECPKMQRAFKLYVDASEDFVSMLTNEELDAYYAQRDYARRFMNVLETVVHARLVTGGAIPSAKLVEKRVNREWKPGAEGALKQAFGDAAFKPKKIKSPAEIEKLSSRGKAVALEYGYKPESYGYSVAPIGDPRPEAKVRSNATVFEHAAALDNVQNYSDF